jgi:hypothetical protein
MVKAYRHYWSALDLPENTRGQVLKSAWDEFEESFVAFPIAAETYSQLGGEGDPNLTREERWEAQRQLHLALYRALLPTSIPKTIKTSDLLSPFDGKPLQYTFDGKQMTFAVSEPGTGPNEKPPTLNFPPDSVFKKAKS